MSDINNALEILVNLIYLAKHSVDDPEKVMDYLCQAEMQALKLAEKHQQAANPTIGTGSAQLL